MGELVFFCAGTNREILPGKQVDSLLINVPQYAASDSMIRETVRLMKASRAKTIMLDSGGYQLLVAEGQGKKITCDYSTPIELSEKVNLAPKHVIDVARRLMPDIMVALDFPIRKISNPAEQEIEFNRKLGFNARWA